MIAVQPLGEFPYIDENCLSNGLSEPIFKMQSRQGGMKHGVRRNKDGGLADFGSS